MVEVLVTHHHTIWHIYKDTLSSKIMMQIIAKKVTDDDVCDSCNQLYKEGEEVHIVHEWLWCHTCFTRPDN